MRQCRILRYSLLCSLYAGVSFLALPAQAKSLQEVILTAWKNHPSVEVAQGDKDFAAKEISEERSAYYPQLNFSAQTGRMYADNATTRGFATTRGAGYSNLWDGTVSVRQSIFDGGERKSRVDAAKIRTEAAETGVYGAQNALAGAVASAYIEVLRVYRGLSMIDGQRAQMEDYFNRLQIAVDNGAANTSDLSVAHDLILAMDDLTARYETELKMVEAAYYEIVGEPVSGELTTPLVAGNLIPARAGLAYEQAQREHVQIVKAKLDAESAAQGIQTEQSSFYPDIDGELSYLKSEKKDLIGGEAEDARAVVRMNWNFETGGGAFHRVDKRRVLHEQAQARIREIERRLERDINLSYAEYEGALKQLEVMNERLAVSQQIMSLNREQFEGARISLLQLMQAENQYFMTGIQQVNAQHRVLAAQYGILSTTGAIRHIAEQRQASLAAPMIADNGGGIVHE